MSTSNKKFSHFNIKKTDQISQKPSCGVITHLLLHSFLSLMLFPSGGLSGILLLFLLFNLTQVSDPNPSCQENSSSSSLLFWIVMHMLRLQQGSAEPWRHKVSEPQCRPESGWGLAGRTGRPRCAAHEPGRRP